MIKLHFYTVEINEIEKPLQLQGYYLISYIKDNNGNNLSVKIGDTIIINSIETKIIDIRFQESLNLKLEESALGWKNWMKFDKDLNIDCHQEKSMKNNNN